MRKDPLEVLFVDSKTASEIKDVNKLLSTLSEKDWGKKDSIEYKTTVVLLSSAIVGGFAEKIARVLGYDIKFVKNIGKEARENKIWTKDGRVQCEWMDKKTGGIALACDTAVCLGWLKRSEEPAKELGSKGGIARAKKLTPARRKEIATVASHARKWKKISRETTNKPDARTASHARKGRIATKI
mgnify:CR=1 FL=1